MKLGLIWELTKRDFQERYSGSVLGMAWSFIWPLVNMFIYIVIFAKIMGAKLPGFNSTYSYGIYLVAGLVPWTAFTNTVSRASSIFVEKKVIISKMAISLPSLPLYIVMSESVTFIISLAIYLCFLLISGLPIHASVLLLPFVYLIQQLFAYALGLLVATFHVFLRDLREAMGIVLQLWFWFTPIVYVVDILPDWVKTLFAYNPAYLFISAYHDIFIFQQSPNCWGLIKLTILAHLLLLIAYVFFKKLEKDIRDFI